MSDHRHAPLARASGCLSAVLAVLLATVPVPLLAGDLWDTMCDAPRLPVSDRHAVEREARSFAESSVHFRELMHRAEPWMWHIVEAVSERDMPIEVALLPAIESAFQPHALSPRNAGGFWQFMPATARTMGLRVDEAYDGRADIADSTRAALSYLEHLHRRFGSWPLALAAYNAGEARISRAISRQAGSNQRQPPQRTALALPEETVYHFVRLKALLNVICAPQEYGVHRPGLPARPLIEALHFNRRLTLDEAAALSATPVDDLRQINPALRNDRTPVGGPHRVWFPAHRTSHVLVTIAQLDDLALVTYGTYTVTRGDSLSVIAQRHDTSVAELVRLNDLPGHRINIGQKLRIPLSTGNRSR